MFLVRFGALGLRAFYGLSTKTTCQSDCRCTDAGIYISSLQHLLLVDEANKHLNNLQQRNLNVTKRSQTWNVICDKVNAVRKTAKEVKRRWPRTQNKRKTIATTADASIFSQRRSSQCTSLAHQPALLFLGVTSSLHTFKDTQTFSKSLNLCVQCLCHRSLSDWFSMLTL